MEVTMGGVPNFLERISYLNGKQDRSAFQLLMQGNIARAHWWGISYVGCHEQEGLHKAGGEQVGGPLYNPELHAERH